MEKKIPNQIKKSLKRWETQSSMLQFLYVFLGAIAIIAPLVVASFTDLLGDLLTRLVSFCGAFAVGLIGGFRLSKQANKMRRAYIELRSATVRYEACPDVTLDNLVEEYTSIAKTIGSIIGPEVQDLNSNKED